MCWQADLVWGVQGGTGRGLTSSEVLNDEASFARVCLRGQVNGEPFAVERTIKRSALSSVFSGMLNCHITWDVTCDSASFGLVAA